MMSDMPDQWFRYWMPYCFQKLAEARHKNVYLPLNRNYKPLGFIVRKLVKYDDYFDQAVIFTDDPHKFINIWTNHRDDKLWLYNDTPSSKIDYFDRLERLLSRSVRLVAKLK